MEALSEEEPLPPVEEGGPRCSSTAARRSAAAHGCPEADVIFQIGHDDRRPVSDQAFQTALELAGLALSAAQLGAAQELRQPAEELHQPAQDRSAPASPAGCINKRFWLRSEWDEWIRSLPA